MPQGQLTSTLTEAVEHNFYIRCPPEKRPEFRRTETTVGKEREARSESPESPSPSVGDKGKQGDEKRRTWFEQKPKQFETDSAGQKIYDSSLAKALHRTFFLRWWTAGFLKLVADTLKTTTPLVNKVILTWLTEAYIYHRLSDDQKAAGVVKKPQGIGYGVGLAFALFAMQRTYLLFLETYCSLI